MTRVIVAFEPTFSIVRTEKELGCGVTNNNPVKIGVSYIEYTRD